MKRRRWLWIAIAAVLLYGSGCVAGGILLAELQLHPWRMPFRFEARVREVVRTLYHAEVQEISVSANDGVALRAWYVVPEKDNGNAVILLHGVGDNREGAFGYARLFLDRGYRVLLPDARAHGKSDGELATYGLREKDDVRRWVEWLAAGKPQCVYGFGESMGAALLLQALSVEARFCAVIAESPFARFEAVAYERAARYTRLPFWVGKTVERPVVMFALWYSRRKYGLDFRQANPIDAIVSTKVPVLLIADEKDLDILPHHVLELHQANPATELWEVKGAAHGGAWADNPAVFNARVTEFFAQHARK